MAEVWVGRIFQSNPLHEVQRNLINRFGNASPEEAVVELSDRSRLVSFFRCRGAECPPPRTAVVRLRRAKSAVLARYFLDELADVGKAERG